MRVDTFIQGEQDGFLFAAVGPWLVSRAVHEDLASAVVAAPGDLWHVAFDGNKPVGFAVTTFSKNAVAHIRFLYASEQPVKVRAALLATVMRALKDRATPRAYTFAREDDAVWAKAGFTKGTKRGKVFCTFDKTLTEIAHAKG